MTRRAAWLGVLLLCTMPGPVMPCAGAQVASDDLAPLHPPSVTEPLASPDPPTATSAHDPALNLDGRLGDIHLIDRLGGGLGVTYRGRDYSAEQYLALIASQQHRRDAGGVVFKAFNITTVAGVLWVGLGLLGQVLFTGRMVIQWLVSEKQQRSVVPPIFWHLSLAGASMLLAYFIWRKDLVGVIGQATGFFIYVRNVYLIHFATGPAADLVVDDPLPVAGD